MTPGAPPFDLGTFFSDARARVEAALAGALLRILPQLPDALRGPVRQGVMTGGKRLRPILCVEGWRAATGTGEGGATPEAEDAAHALGASLELIHAYSLMHDDLPSMDDAPLRRGEPTPHTRFGEGPTTVGGAALIPAAGLEAWRAAHLLGCSDEAAREVVRILARAAGGGGMVGGQALDLEGEGRALSREELDTLHRAKTGALLTASLSMGAVAGGAAPRLRDALEAYGRAIGLAFQVADDVLDATADEGALGKRPSDQALEKSTYVRLHGVESARAEARALVAEALRALDEGGIPSPPLRALARYVVERDR